MFNKKSARISPDASQTCLAIGNIFLNTISFHFPNTILIRLKFDNRWLVRNMLTTSVVLYVLISRHTFSIIAPIPIYTHFRNPILHCINHCITHISVREIQISHICPIETRWRNNIAISILCVPISALMLAILFFFSFSYSSLSSIVLSNTCNSESVFGEAKIDVVNSNNNMIINRYLMFL